MIRGFALRTLRPGRLEKMMWAIRSKLPPLPNASSIRGYSRHDDDRHASFPSVLAIHPCVQTALDEGQPVVALESTIISHGMPYPENLEMAR